MAHDNQAATSKEISQVTSQRSRMPDEPTTAAARFRKKPVVIEAIQYRPHENCADVAAFMGQKHNPIACRESDSDSPFIISTLEGEMMCGPGDWIIKGVKGEFYPCKPDIFAQTYERIPTDAAASIEPTERLAPDEAQGK